MPSKRNFGLVVLWFLVGSTILCLPLLIGQYYIHILTISFYYVILSTSWNLLSGYTGQFSLAHVAFAGMGAYTSALLVNNLGIPIWLGIVLGGIGATLFGLVLGFLSLRAAGIYLGVATWAFAETFRLVVSMMYKVTRGDLGLPTTRLFGTSFPVPYYYLFCGLSVTSVLFVKLIMRKRAGYFFRAIRDDELVARTMGIRTVHWKILAFCISALMAGIAGAFYGHYVGLLSPAMLQWYETVSIIIMVVIGGIRTIWGPVIGAVTIELLSEFLRPLGAYRMVMFAVAVILIMRLYPKGIMGLLERFTVRRATLLFPMPTVFLGDDLEAIQARSQKGVDNISYPPGEGAEVKEVGDDESTASCD